MGVSMSLFCTSWHSLRLHLFHSSVQLLARSAFCPIFRAHGRRSGSLPEDNSGTCGRTGASNEIWNFGEEAEAAIAKVMRVREQLRPYIMEQYRVASQTGTPVMRPLFYDYWDDPVAATIDDQLMFGPGELQHPLSATNALTQTGLPTTPSQLNFHGVGAFRLSRGPRAG